MEIGYWELDICMSCLFCHIVSGEIPKDFRYQDDTIVAFDDIHPKAPVHILVIPRQHVARVQELSDPTLAGRLLLAVRRVARDAGIADSGFRITVNCGPDGGEEVPHLHIHVLGGRKLGPMIT